jgi:hypothetical protein
VLMAGARDTFRDAFELLDTTARWTIVQTGMGDVARVDGNAAAASYLVISKSPLNLGTETIIESKARYRLPLRLGFGAHMSQRTLGQEFAVELVSTDDSADVIALTPYVPVAIASISQTTTVLTVNTTIPHGLTVGDRVETHGVPDSRLNYQNLVVATVPTATQFTATAGAGGTIASVTAGPFNAGTVSKRPSLGWARNGISMIFENATVTNASIYTRSEAGDAAPSGTIAGNHSTTIGTTASLQLVNVPNIFAFGATNIFEMVCLPDGFTVLDYGADATTAATNTRAKRTRVVPNPAREYKLRIRARNSNAMTVPIAEVVSATKTGTTTATIVTDVATNLTTGDQVVVPGIRNQTDFAPALATVASIINATSFTVVFGTAVTAVSYGGSVYRANGNVGAAAMGALGQYGSSVSRAANVLTLNGNAAWTGVLIGDYVNLHGVRADLTGADLGLDGMYRVLNVATTVLTLEPLTADLTGNDIALTNCGGTVIRRTDLRLDFVRIQDFNTIPVEAFGGLTRNDQSAAIPMVVQGTPTFQGTAGQGATATGNPVMQGLEARTSNGTAVTNGQVVRAMATPIGALVNNPFAIPDSTWSYPAGAGGITNNTDVVARVAGGAGIRNYVTAIQLRNSNAVATEFVIKDGASTILWRDQLPANMADARPITFPVPLRGSAATALNIQCVTTGAAVYANLQGYFAPKPDPPAETEEERL